MGISNTPTITQLATILMTQLLPWLGYDVMQLRCEFESVEKRREVFFFSINPNVSPHGTPTKAKRARKCLSSVAVLLRGHGPPNFLFISFLLPRACQLFALFEVWCIVLRRQNTLCYVRAMQ